MDARSESPEPRTPWVRVRDASRRMREILVLNAEIERQVGKKLGVNRTDMEAMQHLIANGPLSVGELARLLDVSTAAATVSTDRLVKVGHVTRERHEGDRRRISVTPNPDSARKTMHSILPMIIDTDAILDDFSPEEQGVITNYLSRVVELMHRQLQEPDPDPN